MLTWTYTPQDYFEEAIEVSHRDYTITIADGQVRARVDSAIFEADQDIRQQLHDNLNDRLLGVQLVTHRSYQLSGSAMTRVHSDGRRDIFIEPECARIEVSSETLDILVTDKNGNVIADTKRDRVKSGKMLGDLISAYRPKDLLLASLLQSYSAAVRDPDNELVHLYEIRDALKQRFSGQIAALKALDIEKAQWSRLGQLSNDEPLLQGRHRGSGAGVLREATAAELAEARGIARSLIEAYIRYLADS